MIIVSVPCSPELLEAVEFDAKLRAFVDSAAAELVRTELERIDKELGYTEGGVGMTPIRIVGGRDA